MTQPKNRNCFGSGVIAFIGVLYAKTCLASGSCCAGGVAAAPVRVASAKPCALTLKKGIG
jgi:hypothetical protein